MNETTRTGAGSGRRAGRAVALGLTAVLIGLPTCGPIAVADAAPARQSLTGLFRLQAGTWGSGAHGSYFRMLQPDGRTYLTNTSSKAGDKSYTLLSAGTDGGLRTGGYQLTPKPAFAGNGDALSGKVTAPTDFFGIKFATATNSSDPQTGQRTATPNVYATGSRLSGNLSAFAASWNNQHFNQGSPKPNGSSPGFTRTVSGTYNASTRAYSLTWRSLIVGGPFNKFTGEWHLSGTFVPAEAAKAPAPVTRSAQAPPASTRSTPRTRATTPARTSAPKPVTSSTKARPTTRSASPAGRATPSARRSTPVTTATPSAQPGSVLARASSSSADRIAARTVADHSDETGPSPWLIAGIVAVLALFGLVAFRLVRARSTRV